MVAIMAMKIVVRTVFSLCEYTLPGEKIGVQHPDSKTRINNNRRKLYFGRAVISIMVKITNAFARGGGRGGTRKAEK